MIDNIVKYENWRTITESDYVTMFIKTWFTHIACLRETFPEVKVFAEDGKPRGDKPYLNKFKSELMDYINMEINLEYLSQNLYLLYNLSSKKVFESFSQYYFTTFFRMNEKFHFLYKNEKFDSDRNKIDFNKFSAVIEGRYTLKVSIELFMKYRDKNYNKKSKFSIDCKEIINECKNYFAESFDELAPKSYMMKFYALLFIKMKQKIERIENEINNCNYTKTVTGKLIGNLNLAFGNFLLANKECEKYPHQFTYAQNESSVILQLPFNSFVESEMLLYSEDDRDFYQSLLRRTGLDWFSTFVYDLRNALFHEIIDPLDVEWQQIFKSAYLILKEIVDINIQYLKLLNEINDKATKDIAQFIDDTIVDRYDDLATHVYLEEIGEIEISEKEIKDGLIYIMANAEIKLKLQFGSRGDQRRGDGVIQHESKNLLIEAEFDFDFELVNIFIDE